MRKLIVIVLFAAVASARADQKNVHVLTGLTDAQLLDAMNFMRGSLGVHCDYCHVVKEKTGWDFADDSKDAKRTARRMIEMTMQINEQNFENNPDVSCYSCHRGAVRPVALPSMPQAIPPFPTPVRQRPTNLPTRDAVVQKYAAALGDVSRLNAPRAFKGTRETNDGKSAPIEGQVSKGRVHVIGQTPFGQTEQVFIGTAGWIKTDKGTKAMTDEDLGRFRTLADAYEPLHPDAIAADARVINTEKIGDHDTVIVGSKIDNTTRQRLYFDTATGLLVRRVILQRSSIGEIPTQIDYDDYRDVGGTKFPFTMRISLMDPWNSAARHYSDVQLGAAVDDKVFSPLPVTPPKTE